MKFSQRMNYTPLKNQIQFESMDNDLMNGLWNVINKHFITLLNDDFFQYLSQVDKDRLTNIWINYFKYPIDTLPEFNEVTIKKLRTYYFDESIWYEKYDFIEYISNCVYNKNFYCKDCNEILERELSAYRFISDTLAPITNSEEINEVDEAIKNTGKLKGVHIHLEQALQNLSDRNNPDYRNSIKESISAVESITSILARKSKAELGSALNEIENSGQIKLHSALKEGYKKLYGYTSDAEGIRHGLLDEPNIYFEDAKYMLVSCSAFTNYLIEKARRAGIDII